MVDPIPDDAPRCQKEPLFVDHSVLLDLSLQNDPLPVGPESEAHPPAKLEPHTYVSWNDQATSRIYGYKLFHVPMVHGAGKWGKQSQEIAIARSQMRGYSRRDIQLGLSLGLPASICRHPFLPSDGVRKHRFTERGDLGNCIGQSVGKRVESCPSQVDDP